MNSIFPMTPAQSWAFIGMLAIGCILVTYIIYGLDQFISLAIWNCKLTGVEGIMLAARGYEAYEILHERVIEVSRKEVGYVVTTTDTERNYRYVVITSSKDEGNRDYDEAIRLAGTDERLKKALLPESRVKNYFVLKNEYTGDETEFFVVYVNFDNQHSIETALNKYFDDEYFTACREARNIA